MINEIRILGRLGKDATIRSTQAGDKVATFSVATWEKWKNDEGEWQEATEWHTVVTFQPGLVSMLERHGRKGRLVAVGGKMTYRTFEHDGINRVAAEIKVTGDGYIRFVDRLEETQE
jgi:single-strand DNA-binding protein